VQRRAIWTFLVMLLVSSNAHADELCGESELGDEALAALAEAQDHEDAKTDDAGVLYHVPVFIHVVRKAPQGEGDMPVAHAKAITLDVLNRTFAEQHIPFQFDLAKIDYLNADDATYHLVQSSAEERQLYDDVNVTGRRNLNLYIVGPRADTSVTGWAEFLVNPALLRGDHVVLRYYPAKGGFSDPLVPVHEVGHWLGLLHTFQYGCGTLVHSDLIRDTPTQSAAVYACTAHSDSCPDEAGEDPVDNIMGYAHACRGTFSPGQIKRMRFLYRYARGGKGDDEPVLDDTEAAEQSSAGCQAGRTPSSALWLLAVLALLRRRSARDLTP